MAMTARDVYQLVCATLDEDGWNYDRVDADMKIFTGVRSNDLPISMNFSVKENTQVLMVYSVLPFKVIEEKRVEMALAISVANDKLVNGVFDYSLENGTIAFRVVESYRGCTLSRDLIRYLRRCVGSTVDHFNDKFDDLNNGKLSFEDFVQQ